MKFLPFLLLNLILAFNAFAQHNDADVHTHLFNVHCSSCNTPVGKLSLINNQSDSLQILVAKDAIVIKDSGFQCKVCSQHLFDEEDLTSSILSDQYTFNKPTKNSVLNLRLNEELSVNLKNFCPVCHQKVTRKIHPKGYASTNFKFKKVKKAFN